VDSADFYSTLNYFQAHPSKFSEVLALVDSNLTKIKPSDTTTIIAQTPQETPPDKVDKLLNFRGTAEELKKKYPQQEEILRKIKSKQTEKYE
jgi:hypothetical protein